MAITQEEKEFREAMGLPLDVEPSSLIPEKEEDVSGMLTSEKPKRFSQRVRDSLIEAVPEFGGVLAAGLFSKFFPPAAPAIKRFSGEALSALIGTVSGESARQILAEEKISGKEMVKRGLQNAVLDFSGNLVFSTGGKIYKVTKDTLKNYGYINVTPFTDRERLLQLAQEVVQKTGGTLSKFQVNEGAISGIIESIGRFGYSGKNTFEQNDKVVQDAINQFRDSTLKDVSKLNLSDKNFGLNFKRYIEQAGDNLSKIVSPFYKTLDQTSEGITVNVSKIKKENAKRIKNALERSSEGDKMIGVSGKLKNLYNDLSDLSDTLSFNSAHELRSDLNGQLNEIKQEFKGTKAEAYLTQVIKNLNTQMDEAAKNVKVKLKNPNIYEDYIHHSNLYKKAMNNLYGDVLKGALKQNPEKVGEEIYKTGNVTSIEQAFKAIEESMQLAEKAGVNINVAQGEAIKNQLKKGYMRSLVKSSGVEFDVKTVNKLKEDIVAKKDPRAVRTFEAMFSEQERKQIKNLVQVAEVATKKPGVATLSLFLAGKQAGALNALLTAVPGAVAGGYLTGFDAFWSSIAAAGTLMTPKVFAKISLNSDAVNKIIKAERLLKKDKFFSPGVLTLIAGSFVDANLNPDDWKKDEETISVEEKLPEINQEQNEEFLKAFQ